MRTVFKRSQHPSLKHLTLIIFLCRHLSLHLSLFHLHRDNLAHRIMAGFQIHYPQCLGILLLISYKLEACQQPSPAVIYSSNCIIRLLL